MSLVSTVTGLLGLLVAIGGIGVSAMHLGKVRGAGLLLAGFSLQAFAGIIFRLAAFVVPHLASSSFAPAFMAGSIIGVTGSALVLAGLYTLLGSLTPASAGSRA